MTEDGEAILRFLSRSRGLTEVQAIAEVTGRPPRGLSRLLGALEVEGHVSRHRRSSGPGRPTGSLWAATSEGRRTIRARALGPIQ